MTRIIVFCNDSKEADELIKQHCTLPNEAIVITNLSYPNRIKGYKDSPAFMLRELTTYESVLCEKLGIKPEDVR